MLNRPRQPPRSPRPPSSPAGGFHDGPSAPQFPRGRAASKSFKSPPSRAVLLVAAAALLTVLVWFSSRIGQHTPPHAPAPGAGTTAVQRDRLDSDARYDQQGQPARGPVGDQLNSPELPNQGHPAAVPPPRRCKRFGIPVCSHRGAGFPNDILEKQGTEAAVPRLADAGITCFDVDIFLSSDSVVFVGHPRLEAARAGIDGRDVETVSSADLRQAGSLPYSTFMRMLWTHGTVSTVTMEPKGRMLHDNAALDHIAVTITESHKLVHRVALIIDHLPSARRLRSKFPALLLAASIKDQGRQDIPDMHRLCDSSLPARSRLTYADVYDIFMPSVRSLGMPGCLDVLPKVHSHGKQILGWLVDTEMDEAFAIPYTNILTGLISNHPFYIADNTDACGPDEGDQ